MSNVGRTIYGYCNGFFGEDYTTKRIEAEGYDWIVARPLSALDNPGPFFAQFKDANEKQAYIDIWSQDEEDA